MNGIFLFVFFLWSNKYLYSQTFVQTDEFHNQKSICINSNEIGEDYKTRNIREG